MQKSIAIFFFVIFSSIVFSQTKEIEILKKRVTAAANESEKITALFALCEQRNSLGTDTLYKYAAEAKQIAATQKNEINTALAEYYLTHYLVKKALLDSALHVCNTYINVLKNDVAGYDVFTKFSALKGHILIKSDHYKEAIAQYYSLLNLAEQKSDNTSQVYACNGIGWAYMEMERNRDALNWLLKAASKAEETGLIKKYSLIYSNIGAVYNNINKNDSAEYFIDKSIKLARADENLVSLANALNIKADILIDTRRSQLAEALLNEALAIRRQIGDPFYIVSDISELAIYYAHNSQQQKGIDICKEGIAIVEKYNLYGKLAILYDALAENYKAGKDYENYSATLQTMMALKDSMYTKNSAEAIAAMEAKYNLQKKENLIIRQQNDISKHNYILTGLALFLILAAIIVWLVFRDYNRKSKTKLDVVIEEEKRLAFEAITGAKEVERKRIAADLHDNVGAYASAISANADALLQQKPDNNILQGMKNNAAEIMISLRDTIWILNKDLITITAISDRFKSYVQKISSAYSDITMDFKENISNNVSLSPENALNLLRILQEAFHNAIKHSKCTHITIIIESAQDVAFSIIDNGRGFDYNNNINTGNGLQNMQARAKTNGWKLLINNLQPAGTSVQLSLPVL